MPEMQIEDVVLLHQLVREPENGIRLLQQQYGSLIYRIVCRVLPEYPQDAEEVAADVLVKTWENASFLLEDNRPLMPWLIVTARNRAIDRRRGLLNFRTPKWKVIQFLIRQQRDRRQNLSIRQSQKI